MSGYIGPIPVPQGIQNKESFTATAAQTTFNTNGYTDGAFISVYLNGVRLVNGTDYTATNGSDVVLASAANTGDVLDFESFNSFSLVNQTFENITTKNPTHEDTDGGRESAISFQGEQSGGEISTLAAIQASHDGTADDQKGDLIFKTNDGSDNNAPTERLRIDSAGSIIPTTLGTDNVHLGEGAGDSIASGGNSNVVIGKDAGTAITTGDNNVAVGFEALSTEDGHGNNVAVGHQALKTLNAGADGLNVAVGYQAGTSVTTGIYNNLIGGLAGDAITDGSYNVGVGYSLTADTRGSKSTAVGSHTLINQNFTSATDTHNTAVGYSAGKEVTTAIRDTLIGSEAGDALTTGQDNVAVGALALSGDTAGSQSVAVGRGALKVQNLSSGSSNNVAVGYSAGEAVTTAVSNTFVGALAGDAITTSNSNVAIGKSALSAETSSNGNVAVGEGALGEQNVGGSGDARNTAIGLLAGGSITTGEKNTLVGALCADSMTTNTEMTAIGYNLAATSQTGRAREILIGSNGTGGGSNTARFCTSSGVLTIDIDGSDTSWAAASDLRLKKDVADSTVGLAFIKDLRPITFKWNAKNAIEDSLPQYDADSSDPVFGEGKAHHGFIAQEIKAVIDAHSDIVNGHNIWKEDPDGTQQVAPSALVPMLVKAIQELSVKNDALEAQNTTQATQIADLITRVEALEAE